MTREKDFIISDGSTSTFARDEHLNKLPLPKLSDTLDKYYKSLLPFGSDSELKYSKKLIEHFKIGIGTKLHELLEAKAKMEKNWIEKFWEDYAYHELRDPLAPYIIQALPILLEAVGIQETRENRLKLLARVAHYMGIYWQIIRDEKLKPSTNPDGTVVFSSNQFKRLFNTVRIPGEVRDKICEYFQTSREGNCCSSNVVVLSHGRTFYFDMLKNGKLLSPQDFLQVFTEILESPQESIVSVPILTNDERTGWYRNRKHLLELAKENENSLKIIEEASIVYVLDEREPRDIPETCLFSLAGNFQNRWIDKSACIHSYKNGKFASIGEHSCYDGPVVINKQNFLLTSFLQDPEPAWDVKSTLSIPVQEISFKTDDKIDSEFVRVQGFLKKFDNFLTVTCQPFENFGKKFMKEHKIHPDCFVQMGLQLAYFKMHEKLAPTYETATMRVYYHGRTETVRSCSIEVKEWIDRMYDPKVTDAEKAKYFKSAANSQLKLMNDARAGKGVDRHLFALMCIARENNIPIPSFYDDPLYSKSGGGGNFVLSTSTLGYTICNGCVAPMVLDGYGVFYTMLDNYVWIIISAYKDSKVTSGKKFYDAFSDAMNEIKVLLENSNSKL